MIKFILNNNEISTGLPPGTLLIDFIRYHRHLNGTKIGCREGDCGACTVLVGERKDGELVYRSFVSCLTPLANVHEKHVITIEGINNTQFSPVQQALLDEAATQCGFCTPGFVVSLTGFCLSGQEPNPQNAIAAIDGNICRCTGYKSIERAAGRVALFLKDRAGEGPMPFAVRQGVLPEYCLGIKERLQALASRSDGKMLQEKRGSDFVGGGTDLFVQKPEEMKETASGYLFNNTGLKGIQKIENRCFIGPSATVTDLAASPIMHEYFPRLKDYIRLVSSTPIRNMATIAGNFINASPIGDLTIFFLALDAQLVLSNGSDERTLPLRRLYKGYKSLDKAPNEYIKNIWFELPGRDTRFNFEKVSKRTHLDIASVNTATSITIKEQRISEVHLSAGGVGPIPLYLEKTVAFLKGKTISNELITEATDIAQTEIAPISDARGSEGYKRLLLSQLIKAHFQIMMMNF